MIYGPQQNRKHLQLHNKMTTHKENKWKKNIDNLLIFNIYLLIAGAVLFLSGVVLSINGNSNLYTLFQKLWFPLFIPALSLFFTAILIEATLAKLLDRNNQ